MLGNRSVQNKTEDREREIEGKARSISKTEEGNENKE
jgi:hypothetical protein